MSALLAREGTEPKSLAPRNVHVGGDILNELQLSVLLVCPYFIVFFFKQLLCCWFDAWGWRGW